MGPPWLYILLLYSKVPAEMRLVLRVLKRDSIPAEPERGLVGPCFEVIGGVTPPYSPYLWPWIDDLPTTLLLAIRSKADTVRRITFDHFCNRINSDPDYIQVVFFRPRLHCYGSLFDPNHR